ncbi:MAG: hypothetical protein H8D45_00245 [Bacteroidetes bacterium]|nr:hypothetical protein [Bacteroidota bacterium]
MNIISQGYISKQLTHFAGRHCANLEAQYKLFLSILKSGRLSNSEENAKKPEGISEIEINYNAKISQDKMYIPQMVCFCDIPFKELKFHIKKYSRFGIAFYKDFIVRKGGTPVYYLPLRAQASYSNNIKKGELFDKELESLNCFLSETANKKQELKDGIKHIQENFLAYHIFSYVKFFDHELPDGDSENYYFEREWRLLGNLDFNIGDIATILIPKNYKKRLEIDFPEYNGKVEILPNK